MTHLPNTILIHDWLILPKRWKIPRSKQTATVTLLDYRLFMGKVFQVEVLTLPVHKFSFFLESLEYTIISSPVLKLRYRQSGPK